MMTWEEREAYTEILRIAQRRQLDTLKEQRLYEEDCRKDPFLDGSFIIRLEGAVEAYQDIIEEICKKLEEKK